MTEAVLKLQPEKITDKSNSNESLQGPQVAGVIQYIQNQDIIYSPVSFVHDGGGKVWGIRAIISGTKHEISGSGLKVKIYFC